MYCPKCRAEYREGFAECADCQVALVAELPPEPAPKYVDLVTVLETADRAVFAVAESLLQSAGIDYVVQNEGMENVFPLPQFGAMQLQVKTGSAPEALSLLEGVDKEPPHDEEVEEELPE